MTTDARDRLHDEIAELLPDYILGAVPDADLRRVAQHLDGCARCRAEFDDALATSSLLFDAGPVDPAIREALVARLSPDLVTPPWPVATRPLADLPVLDAPPPSIPIMPRPTPIFGRASRLVATIAAVVLLALGGWAIVDRVGDDSGDNRIAELTGNPAFAHVLTDAGPGSTAEGMIYVDPSDDQAYVTASGLAPLPEGRGYQVWLFTENGEQVSAGFLPIDEEGNGRAMVTAPEPFETFWAVGLSAEPLSGSPAPTAPLALGGWIR